MARLPDWKQFLAEPNAVGWIGLMLVVIAIGAGVLYFGSGSSRLARTPPTAQATK
jgi:hypothetical protein